MEDYEYRLIVSVERGHLVGAMIYYIAPDGQVSVLATAEFGPFDTRNDAVQWFLRQIVNSDLKLKPALR